MSADISDSNSIKDFILFERFVQDEYGNWTASMGIGGMPDQKSPADCADKSSKYLLELSRAVKA